MTAHRLPAEEIDLEIAIIRPNPKNPRTAQDPERLAELVESIRQHGVLQPILVRPLQEAEEFEVVCGHRRLDAARQAGLDVIPAMVRQLDDREVLEIQVIENLQRADLHPLEEADGYRRLVHEFRYTVDDLAAKVGKSKAYVYARLKLCGLPPNARESFLGGKLTPSLALLIARIPDAKLAAEAAKRITLRPDPMGLREAQDYIEREFMLRLSEAQFDVTEDGLGGAGPCSACQHRTGNQRELFAEVKSPDVCTNPVCFRKKQDALWQRRQAEAKESGQPVLKKDQEKKVFDQFGHGLNYNAPFCLLDGEEWAGSKRITLRKLKKHLQGTVLARNPHNGRIEELVRKEDIPKALAAAGLVDKAGRVKSTEAERKANKAARQKAEIETRTRRELMRLVVEKLEEDTGQFDEAFVGLLAPGLAGETLADVCDEVLKRRGLAEKRNYQNRGSLQTLAKKLRAPEQWALIAEIIITRTGAYSGKSLLAEACAIVEIDRKAVAEAIAAEVRAKAKPPKSEQKLRKLKRNPPKAEQKGRGKKRPAKRGKTTKANPNIGLTVTVDKIRQELKRALNDPGKLPEFLRKYMKIGACRVCGCTDDDCRQCIEATGAPCYWVEPGLCSRCAEEKSNPKTTPGDATARGPLPGPGVRPQEGGKRRRPAAGASLNKTAGANAGQTKRDSRERPAIAKRKTRKAAR